MVRISDAVPGVGPSLNCVVESKTWEKHFFFCQRSTFPRGKVKEWKIDVLFVEEKRKHNLCDCGSDLFHRLSVCPRAALDVITTSCVRHLRHQSAVSRRSRRSSKAAAL